MEIDGVLATDAGLFGLWSPTAFRGIVDYESWEPVLLADEDILRQVTAGVFVPITIGADGAFQFLARAGSASAPAEFSARERAWAAVTSEPYLFVATEGAVLSSIEHVGADARAGLRVPLPAGRWQVRIALIDWEAEPGQQDGDGLPKAGALPDFVVLINPEGAATDGYRVQVETFDRP